MLAEIILLRLEAFLRASQGMQDTTPCTQSRFVPICRGMAFKQSRTPPLRA